ncbi:MAG: hypothetical protein KA213_06015, partial [Flavobacterium sp.]|nr:hypothetical protein [Flavobacterium sp.]
QLENGCYVQPNQNKGYWEINKNKPNVLLWRFNPTHSKPLTVYAGTKNERVLAEAHAVLTQDCSLSLLFSKNNAVEFSRSPEPFLPIVCFTDHCDFDTPQSLKAQREFFKQNQVKVTKGFFLNHFSKRADNASYENDKTELEHWIADGHELAYHSLSQSLKKDEDAFDDFYNFKPPFNQCPTWIDHGYQPYNFSLYQNKGINETTFSDNLNHKNISILWNYIDSGTAALGVINQLNSEDFTLKSFSKGTKKLQFKTKISLLIKNIMFHYYADEKMILKYKGLAGSFKKMVQQKKAALFFGFIRNLFALIMPLLKVFLFWNYHKNKPYKLAKYTPLLFKHQMGGKEFYIFQTLEMVDFRDALHPQNINKLIAEKGLFIAHTYFAVPMKYHVGRIFKTPDCIDEKVAANFQYLSKKISNNEVWNPTLKELVDFLSTFETTVLDIDAEGKITIANSAGIPNRAIT